MDDFQIEQILRQAGYDPGEVGRWAEKIAQETLKRVAVERLLLDLTPGGSEFAGSPEACARWVQERLASVGKLAQERNQLREAGKALADIMKIVAQSPMYGGVYEVSPEMMTRIRNALIGWKEATDD
jgi:uncharacterized protein YgfB (UPF0149 family)